MPRPKLNKKEINKLFGQMHSNTEKIGALMEGNITEKTVLLIDELIVENSCILEMITEGV